MATEVEKLLAQKQKILNDEYVGYGDNKSVLDTSPASFKDVAVNTLESVAKGSAKGLLDLVGGWESLYNYLDAGKDPEAFKPARILGAVKSLTGVNLEKAPYETPYNFASAAAPAAVTTALGVPGLFSLPSNASKAQIIGNALKEGAVAGSFGTVAPLITESPFGQVAIQAVPYAVKGGLNVAKEQLIKPTGTFPSAAETQGLLSVGPMTPGQLTGSRVQLAKEAKVAAAPQVENAPEFVKTQAQSVEGYLNNLFNRSLNSTMNQEELTTSVVNSFKNYGKSLSSQLRSDAAKDFNAAKAAGGKVSTQPVLDVVNQKLAAIPPEVKGLDSLRSSLSRIADEFTIPEVIAKETPSTIVGPSGQPAAITVTPGTPAQALEISIDRLQKNLSAWGEAAYTGKADFGKGNIFEGVAPGQAKGIALDVLKGYRNALDDAIANNVAGADKLKVARDKFSANINKIDEFSNRPLTKAFDVENVSELVPETVATKLKNLPASQRAVLIDVMQNHPDASVVLDTIRKSKFDEVLSKAQQPGAALNEPTFNIETALKELGKKDSEFSFLFKNKQDMNDAVLVLNYMKRALQNETPGGLQGISGGAGYSLTKASGGTTQQANIIKETIDSLKSLIVNPKEMGEILFNPDSKDALLALAKGKTTPEKIQALATSTAKLVGAAGVRAGPMMTPEQAPENATGGPKQDINNMSVEELLKLKESMK
jgi:hypothetical protein